MPKRKSIDWDLVSSCATNGIITVRELEELGLPRQTIAHRLGHGGPWLRLLPGVALLSSGPPTNGQRVEAALRYSGHGAVLTGLAAAARHGLRRLPRFDSLHVLVPVQRRRRAHSELVQVERTGRMPTPHVLEGTPTAPVVRAVLDAARRFTSLDQVRALMAEPVQRGMATPHELATELRAGSQRGSARCRIVLDEMYANVHSPAESWGYRMVEGTSLAAMQWNPRILDRCGSFLGIPDGWMDDVALAWQIDSREFHLSPAHYEVTVRRHTAMTAAGIIVVHTLPSQLRAEPQQVLRDLHRAYAHARQRPRPPVTAVTQAPRRAA